MSNLRKAFFSGTWYPSSRKDIIQLTGEWNRKLGPFDQRIQYGIVPHAGWYYSGIMAYDVIRRINQQSDLLVLLGGHLPENHPFILFKKKDIETPMGILKNETKLWDHLNTNLECIIDDSPDNTTEIQYPLIKAVLEDVKILPIRVPASLESLKIIELIEDYAKNNSIIISILGSTDLIHYGPNYNFSPKESLSDPQSWVKESSMKIIQAMLDQDSKMIIEEARRTHSACSAGAAACVAESSRKAGAKKSQLLSYDTSSSKQKDESFVAYGSVVYAF